MAKILSEKEVKNNKKLGEALKKENSIKIKKPLFNNTKILYFLGAILFSIILSVLVYKVLIKPKEPANINVQDTANVCQLEFNIGHDASAPQAECSKVIQGFEGVQTPEITVGDTVTYILKLSNPSSATKSVSIKRFLDEFKNDYKDYIEVVDVTSSDSLNCSVHRNSSDLNYGTVACSSNAVLAPGQTVMVTLKVKVIKDFSGTIQNEFKAQVETEDGQRKNVTCPAQFKTVTPPPNPQPDIACESLFSLPNGSPITGPVKPGDVLKVTLSALNTGNTSLSNVSATNPLDNTFSSQGAKNLNWLEFKEFSSEVSPEIANNCTVRPDLSGFECTGISLSTSAVVDIPFLVTVKSNIQPNQDITNVSQVKWQDIIVYCKDTVTTSPVNSVCNEQTNTCDVVYRDIQTGETSCNTDADCGSTQPPTYLTCVNQACTEVEGEGTSTCSTDADCSYTTCENEACVTKECTSGNCASTCTSDNDCKTEEQTHLTCQNNACVSVSGAGKNECSNDNDCIPETPTRLVCQNEACVEVEGSGSNECSTDADCKTISEEPKPEAPKKEEEVAYAIPETAGTPWQRTVLFLITGSLFVLTALKLKNSSKDL